MLTASLQDQDTCVLSSLALARSESFLEAYKGKTILCLRNIGGFTVIEQLRCGCYLRGQVLQKEVPGVSALLRIGAFGEPSGYVRERFTG